MAAGFIGLLSFAACSDAPPKDPNELLDGHRYVVPATRGGLQLPADCDFESSFIPVAKCASAPEVENLRALRNQLLTLRGSPAADDRLYDWVSADLASGAADSETARQAVAIIQRGLTLGEDGEGATGSRRAQLLTDLSAAYLLVAEETQSALEVLAALEASLEALEIEDVPEARFNRDLALVLLGVLGPGDVEGEPVLRELAESLGVETEVDASASDCPTDSDLGQALNRWSADPEGGRPDLERWADCLARRQDRFLPAVLVEAEQEPAVLESWQRYRRAQDAMNRGERDALASELDGLLGKDPPEPILVAATYPRAMLSFMDARNYEAEIELQNMAALARQKAYHGLAALAGKGAALIAGRQGRYRFAIEQNQRAMQSAVLAQSNELTLQLRLQLITLLEIGGQDLQAWHMLSDLLRATRRESNRFLDVGALKTAARLARQRGLDRSAAHIQSRAIQIAKLIDNKPAAVSQLISRIEYWVGLDNQEAASRDLADAEAIFDDMDAGSTLGWRALKADLDLFKGLVSAGQPERIALLRNAHREFQEMDFVARIGFLQLALARALESSGELVEAQAVLQDGLNELETQVAAAANWPMATALVSAARPITEELIALLLSTGQDHEVPQVIEQYFGLRGGRTDAGTSLPGGVVRWTMFSLPGDVVHLVEDSTGTKIWRRSMIRDRLLDLRQLLMNQLAHQLPLPEVEQSTQVLSESLLLPVAEHLASAERLVIVPDDSLAGLPFGIFPVGDQEMLIDRMPITYSVTHRLPEVDSRAAASVVSVGAAGSGSGYPSLRFAEAEATSVASLYPDARLLTGILATPENLLRLLETRLPANRSARGRILHVAGHFELNTRSPLDSAIILNSETGASGAMTLGELLPATRDLELLYLSACDTGSAVPTGPHGIFSIAQVLASSRNHPSILATWKLDDEVAPDLAARFHSELTSGTPPEEALRAAQIQQRDLGRHPGSWGALALFH